MKKIILLLLFPFIIIAQDFKLLEKIENVEVKYRLTKLVSSKKNDNYLLEIAYKNVNDYDVFYKGIPKQGQDEATQEFAKLSIPNAIKIKNDIEIYLFGEITATSTNNNTLLNLKSNKEYLHKTELTTSIGVIPEINLIKVLKFIPDTSIKKPAGKIVTLNEGMIVKVSLTNDINGKNLNVGDKLYFELVEDIIIDNYKVVPMGAQILGTVTEARGSGMLGKKGKLGFSIDYLYAPGNKIIKLRSQVTKQLNGSGVEVAAASILLTPFALFINGKNAKYERGTVFEAYIDKATEIN